MKLTNFRDVENLIKQREHILQAIKQVERKIGQQDSDYFCYLSKHRDGSGELVDMTGCGVCEDVLVAVAEVLYNKLSEVDERLEFLGVDINAEEMLNND